MSHALHRKNERMGRMVTLSTICHLAFYILLVKFHFAWLSAPREEPVYYVDVVNLPVANPQAGSPAASGKAPSPPPMPTSASPEMKLPTKAPVKPSVPKAPTPATKLPHPSQTETAREFEERLARLERENEAKHEAAAIEALKKRAAGSGTGQAGMPGGTGKEAGSDYASYIQSRLKDAFRTTIAFSSKNPEVFVRLTIDKGGRVIRYRIERSSGDKLFEDAVARAISTAEKSFTPPPGGGEFEHGFVFRPQGVGKS